jgi:hypothetical protein
MKTPTPADRRTEGTVARTELTGGEGSDTLENASADVDLQGAIR